MSRHYLSERNGTKNGIKIEMTDLKKETREQLATPSKYAGLGTAIAAEVMIGFSFSVGVILAVGVVDGLNYYTGVLTSSGNK